MTSALNPTYMFEPSVELGLFFSAAALGAVLGAVFDIFRVLRIIIRHNGAAVFVEDLLFMLFSGFWFFVFSMTAARGQLRAFLLLAVLLGAALYLLTVGAVVRRAATAVRDRVRRLGLAAARKLALLFSPIYGRISRWTAGKTRKIFRKTKKLKKSEKKVLKV